MIPVFWFLGLSASGKSTLSKKTYDYLMDNKELFPKVKSWEILDGDIIRQFLGSEFGYDYTNRRKSVRSVGLAAKYLAKNNIGVVVANISPFHDLRVFMRDNILHYNEIYCKCSINTCIERDPKGHYKRQFKNGIEDFIGLDIPFQEPVNSDLILDTEDNTIDECFIKIKDYIQNISVKE